MLLKQSTEKINDSQSSCSVEKLEKPIQRTVSNYKKRVLSKKNSFVAGTSKIYADIAGARSMSLRAQDPDSLRELIAKQS